MTGGDRPFLKRIVRPAEVSDIAALTRISAMSFPDPWNERDFSDAIDSSAALIVVCEQITSGWTAEAETRETKDRYTWRQQQQVAGELLFRDSAAITAVERQPAEYALRRAALSASLQAEPSLHGYVVCYRAADEAEIPSIAVDEAVRRQGVGRELLEQLFELCYGEGVRKVFLEVREHNIAAQQLYESVGFLRVGVRSKFYDRPREDAYIMMRELTER